MYYFHLIQHSQMPKKGDQEDHEIDARMRSHKEAVESLLLAANESDEECADDNEVDLEIDGELQIITECWIEPQFGSVMGSPPERIYMENLQYHQLADVGQGCGNSEHLQPTKSVAPNLRNLTAHLAFSMF
uniref:Uncharacterized protein n=1 Tax=Timema douglasi TaxID=61478 RepID=A0A7R8VGC6_TIMDO|nr:unnamed protein product [Timema douglasi]